MPAGRPARRRHRFAGVAVDPRPAARARTTTTCGARARRSASCSARRGKPEARQASGSRWSGCAAPASPRSDGGWRTTWRVPFIELNREIERVAGYGLTEIHNLLGPAAYRRYERRALEETIRLHPEAVIATPGRHRVRPGDLQPAAVALLHRLADRHAGRAHAARRRARRHAADGRQQARRWTTCGGSWPAAPRSTARPT